MKNLMSQLFIDSINIMQTNDWQWPDVWDMQRKLDFLTDSLQYAELNQYFEQCAIIRDVKKKLEQENAAER